MAQFFITDTKELVDLEVRHHKTGRDYAFSLMDADDQIMFDMEMGLPSMDSATYKHWQPIIAQYQQIEEAEANLARR